MSDDESAGEKIVEAGLELINPGGDPDVLRAAATAWRTMGTELDQAVSALDKRVKSVLGEHWRGESADAFKAHWDALHKEVVSAHSTFTEAAKGLDDAADNIEKVNDEIHGIYVEIGVSIGIGVGLSFVTLGFGGAAAAANTTRLAAQAARVATRLGTILRRIATLFRTIVQTAQRHRFLTNVAINWAGGTGGSLAGKAYTGQELTKAGLWEATWQGGTSACAGTGVGLAVGGRTASALASSQSAIVANLSGLTKDMISGVAGGVAGGVSGGLVTDGIDAGVKGGLTSWNGLVDSASTAGVNAVANAVGGALGGTASAGVGHLSGPSDGLVAPEGFTPAPERTGPSFVVEVPLGAVTGGIVEAGKEAVVGGGSESQDSQEEKPSSEPRSGGRQKSVRDVFG